MKNDNLSSIHCLCHPFLSTVRVLSLSSELRVLDRLEGRVCSFLPSLSFFCCRHQLWCFVVLEIQVLYSYIFLSLRIARFLFVDLFLFPRFFQSVFRFIFVMARFFQSVLWCIFLKCGTIYSLLDFV